MNTRNPITVKLNNALEHGLDEAHRAQRSTTRYVRKEPVKAVLISAAVGAAAVGLVALLSRLGSPRG